MNPKPLKTSLLSWTNAPLETMFLIWEQSRHNRPVPSLNELCLLLKGNYNFQLPTRTELADRILSGYGWSSNGDGIEKYQEHYKSTVQKLLTEQVPVCESINFVFLIENMPVAMREQMVRHRVGCKVGPRIGFDIVPDLVDSTFWAQSHRVLDMSHFYDEGQFYVPDSIKGNHLFTDLRTEYGQAQPHKVEELYHTALQKAQEVYAALVKAGVPEEEARNVLPFGVTHRTTWALNLQALKHVIGKRSCWLMQRGFWEELIQKMVQCLCDEVDPIFRYLVDPPCFKNREWAGCPYPRSNEERIIGIDPMPPCPLFLHLHKEEALAVSENCFERHNRPPAWSPIGGSAELGEQSQGFGVGPEHWASGVADANTRMGLERRAFSKFWQRSVDTGEPRPLGRSNYSGKE